MINKVFLSGHVGKEPKVNTFDSGNSVVQISLATTEKGYQTKDGKDVPEKTQWHNIVVNRKGLTDVAAKFVKKGDKLVVVGQLRYRQYTDANDVQHTIAEVYVEELELASKPAGVQQAPAPAEDSFLRE